MDTWFGKASLSSAVLDFTDGDAAGFGGSSAPPPHAVKAAFARVAA